MDLHQHPAPGLSPAVPRAALENSRDCLAPPTIERGAIGQKRAQRVIDFIEKLTVPSGKGAGQPFRLDEFQKQFIRDIYEPTLPNGRRVVRRAILSMARKNGKTALIAAICLAHLIGPEAVLNGEIYSAATDHNQAAIVYKFARQIVELEPELRRLIDITPSTKTMIVPMTGSIYRAISADAGTKHGYLPSLVIYDELAQARNRDLYDVLDTSFGARDEPLFITISTQSNDPEHILSRLIDDGLSGMDPSIVCHLYAAKEDCALDDEAEWLKANPALGSFRDREDLERAIAKAIRMPADEPMVRNLLLNQRVSPTAVLISRAEWAARAGEVKFQLGEEVYLGLDLSSTADLTALVMVSASDPPRVMPFFWKPEEHLAEHSDRDFGTGHRRYQEWARAGHIRTIPGRTIDPLVIANAIAELCGQYRVRAMAYDRWRMGDVLRDFDRIGFVAFDDEKAKINNRSGLGREGLRIVPWGQGFKDMCAAIDALELAIFDQTLVHPNNPCLNWNMMNAVATTDPAGNRKFDKELARFRIDGAVALAMAMGMRSRDRAANAVDVRALCG